VKFSNLAIDFVVKAESNGSGRPYLSATVDELGRASVGYGHTINGSLFMVPMTSDECIDLLKEDLMKWEDWINSRIHFRSIEQHQFDALVCWAYHVGQGRAQAYAQEFDKSLLMRFAAEGKMQLTAAEFDNWVLVKDRPSKKIFARRQAEKYLFLYGTIPFTI
jgi:GH24 family phage-related lysozyme (muramidase)